MFKDGINLSVSEDTHLVTNTKQLILLLTVRDFDYDFYSENGDETTVLGSLQIQEDGIAMAMYNIESSIYGFAGLV